MTTFDAIILAGDTRGAKSVFGKNKAFLEVQGIPSFIRVLLSLQEVEFVGEIRIVGPKEEIKSLLDEYSTAWSGSKTVKVVSQKNNVIDNVWVAFLDMFPCYQEGEKPSPDQKEKVVIVVAGDIPLVTTNEINEFISKCDIRHFDYCVGVVSDKTLSCYAPKKGVKGLRLPALPMKETNCRINNLHIIRPFKIANRYRLQKMYELRYQRKLRNILKLFVKIFLLKGFKGAAFFYLLIPVVLFFRRIGMTGISKKISSFLTLSRFEKLVGRVLGTRISITETTYGGAALDIDNEKDYKIINEKFEEWMELQKRLNPGSSVQSQNPKPEGGTA